MSQREAKDAAWKVYRKELGDTSNWTVSESATYRGFFNHGWNAAIQHARDVADKACETIEMEADKVYQITCALTPKGSATVPQTVVPPSRRR